MDVRRIEFIKFGRKAGNTYALDDKGNVWKKVDVDEWESMVSEGQPQRIKKGLRMEQVLEIARVRERP